MTKIKEYRVYTLRDNRPNADKSVRTFQSKELAEEFADVVFNELKLASPDKTSGAVVIEPIKA